jgi:hypothetical protein
MSLKLAFGIDCAKARPYSGYTMRHLAYECEKNPKRFNTFAVAADCKLQQRISPLRLS